MSFPAPVAARIDALTDRRDGDLDCDPVVPAAELGSPLATAFRDPAADVVVSVYAFDDDDACRDAETRLLDSPGRHVRTSLNGDLLLAVSADPDDRSAVERADDIASGFAGSE